MKPRNKINLISNETRTDPFTFTAACFSSETADDYRQDFLTIGAAGLISTMNQIGSLTIVSIDDNTAEYYFEQDIGGQTITFPVEFIKENEQWKILEF